METLETLGFFLLYILVFVWPGMALQSALSVKNCAFKDRCVLFYLIYDIHSSEGLIYSIEYINKYVIITLQPNIVHVCTSTCATAVSRSASWWCPILSIA